MPQKETGQAEEFCLSCFVTVHYNHKCLPII